jgi:hypothetical protein
MELRAEVNIVLESEFTEGLQHSLERDERIVTVHDKFNSTLFDSISLSYVSRVLSDWDRP